MALTNIFATLTYLVSFTFLKTEKKGMICWLLRIITITEKNVKKTPNLAVENNGSVPMVTSIAASPVLLPLLWIGHKHEGWAHWSCRPGLQKPTLTLCQAKAKRPSRPFNLKLLYWNFHKKNSLNKQGQNSIYKQSKWKASWRNSLRLDWTFKASCYIEILFAKTMPKFYPHTEQMKGLLKELFKTWFNLQS